MMRGQRALPGHVPTRELGRSSSPGSTRRGITIARHWRATPTPAWRRTALLRAHVIERRQ